MSSRAASRARGARYARNAKVLVKGMREWVSRPCSTTTRPGRSSRPFSRRATPISISRRFYEALRQRGFAIYPGKLTKRPSFRIGTIGQIDETVMRSVLKAIREVLREMKVTDMTPARA